MEKKNTESSEHISPNEVDEIIESEPKKRYDDLVTDETNELPTDEEIEEVVGEPEVFDEDDPDEKEEKENDSL